jgi:hypothetical protein
LAGVEIEPSGTLFDPLALVVSIDEMHRSMRASLVCALLGCGAVVGCAKSSAPKADDSSQRAAPAASAGEPSRRTTAPPTQDPHDFGAMFQNEAVNRPRGTITVEEALAAFREADIKLDTVRQHLARPYGARYCVGAKSGSAIALSVCEYIDSAAADAGAEISRKLLLANREIRVNRATTLTVREIEKTPAADAVAVKLFERFARLSALATTK